MSTSRCTHSPAWGFDTYVRSHLIWNTPTSNQNPTTSQPSSNLGKPTVFLQKKRNHVSLVSLLKTKKILKQITLNSSLPLSRYGTFRTNTPRGEKWAKEDSQDYGCARTKSVRVEHRGWWTWGSKNRGGGSTVTSHLRGLWRCFFFGGRGKIASVSLGGYWGCSCRGGVKFKTAGGRFGSPKTSESAEVFMFFVHFWTQARYVYFFRLSLGS